MVNNDRIKQPSYKEMPDIFAHQSKHTKKSNFSLYINQIIKKMSTHSENH